jgi:UDP-N-acetylglucosamine 2-epimerase (non-hydrolysing)
MRQLGELAKEVPVVFPMHPRTRKMATGERMYPGLRAIAPVGYLDFLSLEADAAGVLTDSGGVQEETTYLGVPCFTLRDNTERPVTLRHGTNVLLGLRPERIADILPALQSSLPVARDPPVGWDGRASERVAAVICQRSPAAPGGE